MSEVLARLRSSDGPKSADADLISAAVDALAVAPLADDEGIVLSVPDYNEFGEDIRQLLLDSFARRRREIIFLWRAVAVFLGVEPDLRQHAMRLGGRRVGVVSVDADGLEANVLDIESASEGGTNYLVPVRRYGGIRLPFSTSLFDRALNQAALWLPNDPSSARQLVWGNGLALKRLLGLSTGRAVVQCEGKWSIVSADAPIEASLPTLGADTVGALNEMFDGCTLTLFEGPALYARDSMGNQLVHHVRDALRVRSVYYQPPERWYAAEGCAAFSWRKTQGWRTYLDFLPQLRMSVRQRDGEARFISLISPEARVEGGTEFRTQVDLGLVLRAGTTSLSVFVAKEGEMRAVSLELPIAPTSDVRIGIDVIQRPAQGRARLTIIPIESDGIPPFEIDWRTMQLDPRDEPTIIDALNSAGHIPPTVPIAAHHLLWTSPIAGRSLVDHLRERAGNITATELRMHLSRTGSPWHMTRYQLDDRTLYRAIGTDGNLPSEVAESDLTRLQAELDRLANVPTAIVACSWAFSRCPMRVVETLEHIAETGTRDPGQVNAMGRVFVDDRHFTMFFRFLSRIPQFRQQHVTALLTVLSLREGAARQLTRDQAQAFTKHAVAMLSTELRRGNFKRRCRASIKLIAALLRYRMVDRSFLARATDLRTSVEATLNRVCASSSVPPVSQLAGAALDFLHGHGHDTSILEYEYESDDDDG